MHASLGVVSVHYNMPRARLEESRHPWRSDFRDDRLMLLRLWFAMWLGHVVALARLLGLTGFILRSDIKRIDKIAKWSPRLDKRVLDEAAASSFLRGERLLGAS